LSQYSPVPPAYPPPYPSGSLPYQMPGATWNPLDQLLSPARRAGLLMIIMGVLVLLMAGCFGASAYVMSYGNNPPELQEKIEQMEAELGANAGEIAFAAMLVLLMPAVLCLALGIWVRSGSRVSAVLSMLLLAMMTLGTAFFMLSGLAKGGTEAAAGLCLFGPLIALDVLTIIWLLQAIGNAGQVRQYRDYQSNFWAYAQQQQQAQWPGGAYPGYYGQAGGAYPPPPPAGPTPPPPPPSMPGGPGA
jgi:hypothetical protein